MRLIDADALLSERMRSMYYHLPNGDTAVPLIDIEHAPTIGGWISVKDDLPKERDSIFADFKHLSKHMWAKESDKVIVYVRFPDGTGTSTEGRLQDGKWWTRVSPMLEPVVTHWMPFPEPPEVK